MRTVRLLGEYKAKKSGGNSAAGLIEGNKDKEVIDKFFSFETRIPVTDKLFHLGSANCASVDILMVKRCICPARANIIKPLGAQNHIWIPKQAC